MRKYKFFWIFALAALTVISACGGGGGGGGTASSDSGSSTNLHSVFYRTLSNAPAVSFTLLRQNNAVIANDTLTAYMVATGAGNNNMITNALTKVTDANGNASFAMPAASYPFYISRPTGTNIGGLNDTLTVSSDTHMTYQTSQQQWNVTSSKNFTKLDVYVYQVDSSGKVMWGTNSRPNDNPLVLSMTVTPAAATNTANFTTELFKGSYRVLIIATPAVVTDSIAPFISGIVSATGGGRTENLVPAGISLTAGGNMVSLKLMDGTNPVALNAYDVDIYDRTTQLWLGSKTNDVNGVINILTGTSTDVVAVISNAATQKVVAMKQFTASPTSNETLTLRTFTVFVKPPTGGTLASNDTNAIVNAAINANTGIALFDTYLSLQSITFPVPTDGSGTASVKLFDGSYTLSARNVDNYPGSDNVPVTVSASTTSLSINVNAGGVIAGRIQTQSNTDLVGVTVSIVDTANQVLIGSKATDSTGGYSIAVPYGTYNLWVNGAVTLNLAVSSSNPTVTQNLTQYSVSGRLVDSLGGGLAGSIVWGGGNKTPDSTGSYQINVMQGHNYFVFAPPADKTSIGVAISPDVLIDASTIATN